MKAKTYFLCSSCGYRSVQWYGKCPNCGKWNTLEEETESETAGTDLPRKLSLLQNRDGTENHAVRFAEMQTEEYLRRKTGIGELDRVLGGGLVSGSAVLLSGEPGIGKSTLLLQICQYLSGDQTVLYVSGEESKGQLRLRAERLGVDGKNLYILTETNVEKILAETDKIKPDVMIMDSIQTVYHPQVASTPGSVTQVRESALALIGKAKTANISVWMVGHINKEGSIAGPKILEHMVDAVLYFEGERQQSYRIIRAIKNRYGSTNEIGVFEMTEEGLSEVPNPSEMLLKGRPRNISGNCAVCTMEGTRPIIAEVQSLVTQTAFPSPRRTANGIDYNRMCLIIAVLEKRLGLKFYQSDVYMNVIGGLRPDEPATDVAIALSLISAVTNRVVPDDLVAVGELGLAGECRSVSHVDVRIKEAVRLGFKTIIIPHGNAEKKNVVPDGVRIIPIRGIYEILSYLKETE